MTKIILAVYGVLMLGGGFFGYAKAGSKMSLIMGIVSAVFIFAGLYLSRSNVRVGYGLIAATSVLLTFTFLIRLVKTGSFIPSGMLVILSVIAVIISIKQLMGKSILGSASNFPKHQ